MMRRGSVENNLLCQESKNMSASFPTRVKSQKDEENRKKEGGKRGKDAFNLLSCTNITGGKWNWIENSKKANLTL